MILARYFWGFLSLFKGVISNFFAVILGLFFIFGSSQLNAPTITLLGDNPTSIKQGSLYVDAGATAEDTEEGEIKVVTTGLALIDTSKTGAYIVSYTAIDQDQNKTIATRTVNVISLPIANAQHLSLAENTAKPIILTSHYLGKGELHYEIVVSPSHGTLTGTAPNLNYTPATNYHGDDRFSFKVNDGELYSAPATISLNITAVTTPNIAPVAIAQSITLPQDSNKPITLTGTDNEGSNLSYEIVQNPTHGTLTGTAPNLSYTPTADYHGNDSFTFKVKDGELYSAPATISLSITEVVTPNVAPVAIAQNITLPQDSSKTITLTGTDNEGSNLSYEIVQNPTHGTLTGTAPNLSYTPTTDYHGNDSFTFKVKDGELYSAPAIISLSITEVATPNVAPVAIAQSISLPQDSSKTITLTGTDNEGSSLSYEIVQNPTHGTLTGTAPNLSYTPTADYHGNDSFTFKVKDGELYSAMATISLSITEVTIPNVAPVATAQSITLPQDSSKPITLTGTDNEGNNLSYEIVQNPTHGTLTGTAPNVSYTPAADYHGNDSFTFKVKDGELYSAPATISLSITEITTPNVAPVATAQSITLPQDSSKTITLTGTDNEGSNLSYEIVQNPTHGTLTGTAPNLSYTPTADYHGNDSFTFKVKDGELYSVPATISLSITEVTTPNVAPTITGTAKTSGNISSHYQFLPTAEDTNNDTLTFSIQNKPSWASFDTTTGLLQGIPNATGMHSNIIISVFDGHDTANLPSFNIEVLAAIEIARAYGTATQGGSPSYQYYSAPNLVIDADDATFNHTEGNRTHNWWQVALPKNTLVHNIMIKGRSSNTWRLNDANVYLLSEPYTGSIDDSKRVATLTGIATAQDFSFATETEASYLLVKAAADNPLHLATVEVYGTIPKEPAFKPHEQTYLISGASDKGVVIASLPATDYQNDPLSYRIIGDAPFKVDAQGNVTVDGTLSEARYTFDVQVSDGINTSQTTLTMNVTSTNVIEAVLASGDVINTPVTEEELIQATLDEIESSKTLLLAAKAHIFNLNTDGTTKADSLNNITWNPSHDASLFVSTLGKNTPLLYTNAVASSGYTIYKKEIGIIGEKGKARYFVLGANPLRVTGNDDMNQVMENSLAWLSDRDDLKTAPFKVVIAHLDESYWFKDESRTRAWLDAHYAGQIAYNTENSCDGAALAACLANKPDVLIISQVSAGSDDVNAIAATVNQALTDGISVLYVHHDGNHKALGKTLFDRVFDVTYLWDNYWKKLSLDAYSPSTDLNSLSNDLNSVKTLFTHLKQKDFSFSWGECVDSNGVQGENNDNCTNVTALSAEFQQGASVVKSMLDSFDQRKKNIFLEEGYRIQKLLALTADKFRQAISYPMDKVTSDDNDFMTSYYADHAVYNYRAINPVQTDMGNFSRSDFSHITPTSRAVSLISKKSFRSTGAYALPGQTVTATRTDSSDLIVKVRINTLRSGATHQYQKNGYNRPKYLTTSYFELKKGESVSFTSPYGGTLQLSFDKNDLPVNVTFANVGEHAYWGSEADNASFAQKLAAKEYDWAEVATAGFEVHSKLDKMIQSVEDDRWGRTAQGLAAAIKKYTSNYPHVLAGFKGEGVDVVAEIHDWAAAKNLTIETIDKMKHMNADQATCGYGCSGNPYDAYWSFNPIGHGDIHELGHSLQKKRFEGFPNHAATNTFSYYTKSHYFSNTGGNNDCGGQPFKSLFDTVQTATKAAKEQSFNQEALNAYLKTNLWDKAGLGEQYLLKIQAMMHAQKMGKLENGWHVLARVHILEREKSRAIQDWDAKKSDIGFANYTLDEFKSIRDNDWLVVSYAYAAALDYRNYFDMMGISYSQKARDQIASFGFEAVPNALFVSTDKGYCSRDIYGILFDRPTLPVDGVSVYPY